MIKWLIPALTASVMLGGCASVPRGSIPVVDSSSSVYGQQQAGTGSGSTVQPPQSQPQDSGVVVMVPGAGGSSTPIQTFPAPSSPISGAVSSEPFSSAPVFSEPSSAGSYNVPSSMPSGMPGSGGLAADEQLDGPVLALLTAAQQQQGSGDLNSAASSLERAQRIAPREPQVLYRLAEVRLAQGDAAQAEQFARRGLSYASGRPALQASLWNLIAQAREQQGDPAGAAQAREQARVSL
ncbi:tetratricopeptide repeat protein [Pseudomonas sp.]|uniref:tetratricopeptide repeat protein n=1 Tax=Pseudomonas sp. TaxID=306 RepID=UPI002731B0C5|nr:tetratricopeptide repeat protein [Pseudomonas sp.]MDP2245395.1 tetratricopeptide repeat protein [Pseudomonas sp.]